MLKVSPLMHGVGRGLSSITFGPPRAAANDFVVAEIGWTIAAETDCTVADAEGAVSDTHGHGHVNAIRGLKIAMSELNVAAHQMN